MQSGVLIVDALSAGTGRRTSSRDSIGCGPRSVAGVFERREIPCRIARVESVLSNPRQMRSFDHIAISAMTMDLPVVRKVAGKWKRMNPKGRLLLGGPVTAKPVTTLKDVKPDILVLGEGEATLDELVSIGFLEEHVDCSVVQGVAFLDKRSPKITPSRRFLTPEELSSVFVPSSTRIVDYDAYQAARVYVETVRGCSNFRRTTIALPSGQECTDCSNCDSPDLEARLDCPESIPPGCGFCSVPGTWGPPRSRSEEAIVRDVSELIELGVHRVVLEAPDFLDYHRGQDGLTDPCSPPANSEAISRLLLRLVSLPEVAEGNVHLSIENMKACLFTEEVATVLSESMQGISPNIGLESGSDEHLRSIGKCGSSGDVLRAVRIAKAHDMAPFVYLIYGLPGETPETVKASVNLMREVAKAGAERIILYGFRALPGSAFADFPEPHPKDSISAPLRKEAARINRARKDKHVGAVVRGVVAEPSLTHRGYSMVYPLSEGPLMTVRGGYSPGTVLRVKVVKVLSSGLVEGIVTEDR
ncbi:MAG: B12-binding domain-containing radical SAM protein [Candidatus Hermodarchaeota archaeon]